MNKLVKVLAVSIALVSTIEAGCVGVIVNGKCQGADLGSNYSGNSGYQGSSGRSYQYDMNNGNDRLKYGTDVGAQQRDRNYNDYSGNRKSDRSTGQYGGGIYGY